MRYSHTFLMALLFISTVGCEDENKFNLTPSVGFLESEGSVAQANTNGLRIRFYTNTTVTEATELQVGISNINGLTYGVDYTTVPEPVNSTIHVSIEPEEENASFLFLPKVTGNTENKNINFQITGVTGSDLKVAQSSAANYSLIITGFEEVIPVNLTYNFNDCTTDFATPAGFIEVFENAKTDRGWGCRAFGRNSSRAPRTSAFGGAAGEDRAWMIMNPIEIAAGAKVTIDFWTYSQYAGPGKVSVKWSSNYTGSGDPLVANWTTLSSLDSQFPAANSLTWVNVKGTFTNISGAKVYLAFQSTEGLASGSTAFDIDDLTIKVE